MTSWGRKFVDNGVKDEGVARGGLLILQLHYGLFKLHNIKQNFSVIFEFEIKKLINEMRFG